MLIKFDKKAMRLLLIKESGNTATRFFSIDIIPNEDINLTVSRKYLEVKEEVLEYFDIIWNNRNGLMAPTITEEPVYVEGLNEERTFLRNKIIKTPNFNIESDTYVADYTKHHGREPKDYVKPISPRKEKVTFEGFTFETPKPIKIEATIPKILYIGDTYITSPKILDQYGATYKLLDPINIKGETIGELVTVITYNDLTEEYISIVEEKPLTDIEQMKIIMAKMIGGAL